MKVSILGGGVSGKAAAKLAAARGCTVFVSERRDKSHAPDVVELCDELSCSAEFGGHTKSCLQCDVLVVSPGIPKTHDIVRQAASKNLRILSEVEYALLDSQQTVVAVTGTNGKTTTTALLEHSLNCAGRTAIACGNIGEPVSSAVLHAPSDAILVIELSSYQLDYCTNLKPDVAIVLNITNDHVAYHGSFEAYKRAKLNIFKWQKSQDVLIYSADDPMSATIAAQQIMSAKWTFSSREPQERGAWIHNGVLKVRVEGKEEEIMPVDSISIPGLHNRYNSMAAALALRALSVSCLHIREALSTFQGVEHRLELVRKHNGVTYVNDSKATNVNAAWYALGSYVGDIVWLAGGQAADNQYADLESAVRERVKCIIAFGEEAETIFNEFASVTRVVQCETLAEAVVAAAEVAETGNTVLLSPACKSFDEFNNFAERGIAFRKAVASLK